MIDLSELLRMQRDLQINSFGGDPAELDDEQKVEYIRWNVLALEDELHEALGETGWKPWTTSNHVNREEYLRELVDAFHFLMNLVMTVRLPGQTVTSLTTEFASLYMAKKKVNAARQAAGYDGISGKCEQCGRAREDVDAPGNDSRIWHCICGYNNVERDVG